MSRMLSCSPSLSPSISTTLFLSFSIPHNLTSACTLPFPPFPLQLTNSPQVHGVQGSLCVGGTTYERKCQLTRRQLQCQRPWRETALALASPCCATNQPITSGANASQRQQICPPYHSQTLILQAQSIFTVLMELNANPKQTASL